jgi:hypothetical protein
LVGLRWWSTFTPKGKEIWKFESMVSKNSAVDSTIFWTFQFGSTVAWGVFAGLNIMTFSITDVNILWNINYFYFYFQLNE